MLWIALLGSRENPWRPKLPMNQTRTQIRLELKPKQAAKLIRLAGDGRRRPESRIWALQQLGHAADLIGDLSRETGLPTSERKVSKPEALSRFVKRYPWLEDQTKTFALMKQLTERACCLRKGKARTRIVAPTVAEVTVRANGS